MNLLDHLPDKLRNQLYARAEEDLQDIRKRISLLVDEAKTRNNFEDHMSLMVALMIKFVDNPVTLSMMLAEAVFMLAGKEDNDLDKSSS